MTDYSGRDTYESWSTNRGRSHHLSQPAASGRLVFVS